MDHMRYYLKKKINKKSKHHHQNPACFAELTVAAVTNHICSPLSLSACLPLGMKLTGRECSRPLSRRRLDFPSLGPGSLCLLGQPPFLGAGIPPPLTAHLCGLLPDVDITVHFMSFLYSFNSHAPQSIIIITFLGALGCFWYLVK